MGGPFKLRSGNSPLFKRMGSSPLKQQEIPQEEVLPVLPEKVAEPKKETWWERRKRQRREKKNLKLEHKIERIEDRIVKPEPVESESESEFIEEKEKFIPELEEPDTTTTTPPVQVTPPKQKPPKKKPPKGKPPEEKLPDPEPEPEPMPETRETSWWLGEEGFIPDELQPWVKRPRVPIEKRKKRKNNK